MASSPSYGDRPPLQGFRRSFTAPHRQQTFHDRAARSDADAGSETLFIHPSVKIISFAPPPESIVSESNQTRPDADYPIDTVEALPWRSRNEDLAASGGMIIEKVPGSTWFIKCGPHFAFAILRNSQCWCVDGESKFVWRKRRLEYYRLELPTSTEEEKAKVEELKSAFPKVLKFEKTPCPFKRGFHVDLPDDAITPKRKGKWKPKDASLPNTPDTDTPPLRRTKDSRSWSLQGQSPVPVPESRRTSDMGFAKRLYPLAPRKEENPDVRPGSPSSTASSEEATSHGQPEYSDGTSSVDEHDSINGQEPRRHEKPFPHEVVESASAFEETDKADHKPAARPEAPLQFEPAERQPEIEIEPSSEETTAPPVESSSIDLQVSTDPELETVATSEDDTGLAVLTAPTQDEEDVDNTDVPMDVPAEPPHAENAAHTTPSEEEEDHDIRGVSAPEQVDVASTELDPQLKETAEVQHQDEPEIEIPVDQNKGDDQEVFQKVVEEAVQEAAEVVQEVTEVEVEDDPPQIPDLAGAHEPDPCEDGNSSSQHGESDVPADPSPLPEDVPVNVPVTSEAVSELNVPDEPLDDTASIVSTADSFHTTTSEDPLYPLSRPVGDLLSVPDSPSRARFQHKRGVSEMTITTSNFDEQMEDNGMERPNTPHLIKSSASDDSWSEVQTPSHVQEGLRQRLKTRRSLSPLPPSTTVFMPAASNHNSHMTSVLLQKACNLALVKPIEVVVLIVHVFIRIAGGASLNDLLTGELFKRPDQHRRNASFPDRISPHQDDDEDDFGVPIRGRTRSSETNPSQAGRDTDTDSLFDLD